MAQITVSGVVGLGEIEPGSDIAALIDERHDIDDDDIIVVTSKIISKAEGRIVELDSVEPSPFAVGWAERHDKDARVVEIVLRESRRIVRQLGPVLITETYHGFICANAGVDQSSAGAEGRVVLLPNDPDASARALRQRFADLGRRVAVIVSDTFGRPWREGQTDIALGVAGIAPLYSYIGQHDPHGHEFQVQQICIADELAGAAELVKGNTARVPAAVIRGYRYEIDDAATIAPVLREMSRDLFR